MDIGKNIRRLRRERDVTQEEIARFIQCSPQAISKWECGESLPDIALLPSIAAFFKVTSDELLGMDQSMKQARYMDYYIARQEELYKQYGENTLTTYEYGAQLAELAREGLREFRGDFHFERSFCAFLEMAAHHADDMSMLTETVAIFERALEIETDANLRLIATIQLAHNLSALGETERAVKVARSVASVDHSGLVLHVSRGQERVNEALKMLSSACSNIFQALSCLSDARDENGLIYGHAEQVELYKKCLVIHDFQVDSVHTQFAITAAYYCINAATHALSLERRDDALGFIERAADYVTCMYVPPNASAFPGMLIGEIGVFANTESTDTPESLRRFLCGRMLQILDSEPNAALKDALKEDPRYIAAVARIAQHMKSTGD